MRSENLFIWLGRMELQTDVLFILPIYLFMHPHMEISNRHNVCKRGYQATIHSVKILGK